MTKAQELEAAAIQEAAKLHARLHSDIQAGLDRIKQLEEEITKNHHELDLKDQMLLNLHSERDLLISRVAHCHATLNNLFGLLNEARRAITGPESKATPEQLEALRTQLETKA